jgi:hypothetical protein
VPDPVMHSSVSTSLVPLVTVRYRLGLAFRPLHPWGATAIVAFVASPASRSAPRGVVVAGSFLLLFVLGAVFFVAVGADTWRRGFPIGFPLFASGGVILNVGAVWASIHGVRLQARGEMPRPRDGVLVLRLPDSMRPGWVVSLVGGWFCLIAGALVIATIISDTPQLSPEVRAAGVAALVLLWGGLIAWAFVAIRFLRARLEADAAGIRWDSPYWPSSGQLAWGEIVRFQVRRKWLTRMVLEVTTRDERSRRIPFIEPAIPLSREAALTLTSELEALRSPGVAR